VISLDAAPSSAAWSPGLLAGLCEPAGRRGSATTDPPPKPRPRLRSAAAPDPGQTGLWAAHADPLQTYTSKLLQEQQAREMALAETQQRIHTLKLQALLQNEPFSEASFADFTEFFRELSFTRRPALFLLDNGNLRALWKNDRREQIGLQFLGGRIVQFVIFSLRTKPEIMSRIAGADTIGNIAAQIRANGAGQLFRA
jgi:hypothetical protein